MRRFRRRGETAAGVAGVVFSPAEEVALARRAAALARAARAWEAALAAGGGVAAGGSEFEPIAGVGLAQFAAVSRGVAAFGHDRSKVGHVVASAGIGMHHWETAARGR